jgi:hypothetical protein
MLRPLATGELALMLYLLSTNNTYLLWLDEAAGEMGKFNQYRR